MAGPVGAGVRAGTGCGPCNGVPSTGCCRTTPADEGTPPCGGGQVCGLHFQREISEREAGKWAPGLQTGKGRRGGSLGAGGGAASSRPRVWAPTAGRGLGGAAVLRWGVCSRGHRGRSKRQAGPGPQGVVAVGGPGVCRELPESIQAGGGLTPPAVGGEGGPWRCTRPLGSSPSRDPGVSALLPLGWGGPCPGPGVSPHGGAAWGAGTPGP